MSLNRFIAKIDNLQQRHSVPAFVCAVMKKYNDDEAATQCALITYYGFLSLFPILIVLTSVAQILLRSQPYVHHKIVDSLNQYFPVLSNEIGSGLHSPHRSGLALIVGLLFILYGARGGADAFRRALDRIWRIPKSEQPGFPLSIFISLRIILFGAGGLVAATFLSSFATVLGRTFIFRVFAVLISAAVLYFVFLLVFKWAISSKKVRYQDLALGAVMAAVGIQLLQVVGGFIITHELKKLSTLYGTFALVLGILFWIYLQVQIIIFAVEADSVRKFKMWPRSIR